MMQVSPASVVGLKQVSIADGDTLRALLVILGPRLFRGRKNARVCRPQTRDAIDGYLGAATILRNDSGASTERYLSWVITTPGLVGMRTAASDKPSGLDIRDWSFRGRALSSVARQS